MLNWVKGTPYPRDHFSNVSADIRGSLSVARRGSVAELDEFLGPKR